MTSFFFIIFGMNTADMKGKTSPQFGTLIGFLDLLLFLAFSNSEIDLKYGIQTWCDMPFSISSNVWCWLFSNWRHALSWHRKGSTLTAVSARDILWFPHNNARFFLLIHQFFCSPLQSKIVFRTDCFCNNGLTAKYFFSFSSSIIISLTRQFIYQFYQLQNALTFLATHFLIIVKCRYINT